ncbi:hypothetical protein SLS62_008459 [Diatrype stigma]|uniref:NAD-dependent epimerase/dehydratase domain-containing protein n=1 Tax=Diatrype stigma TaxID=117547 RepID=A0AAN9UIZ6_9PEZI
MSAAKKLVVCGGNGFLGSRICKSAVARGWDVTSISRSGAPKWETVTSASTPPPWAHRVTWERADILRPATYAPLLQGADFVVHSMGILLEADYKGVLQGRESPISGLRKAFAAASSSSSSASSSANPLERNANGDKDEDIRPPGSRDQLTYESMNRDSAIVLARETAAAASQGEGRKAAFAFVSAAGGAPVLPARYIATKREAEASIARAFPALRGIFVRSPFLYDSSRPITAAMAALTGAGALFNSATGGVLGGFMGAAGVKPLRADVVAEALVEALDDESVRGPVEVPQIEALAEKAWRKNML